jgi:hypothetical protein
MYGIIDVSKLSELEKLALRMLSSSEIFEVTYSRHKDDTKADQFDSLLERRLINFCGIINQYGDYLVFVYTLSFKGVWACKQHLGYL